MDELICCACDVRDAERRVSLTVKAQMPVGRTLAVQCDFELQYGHTIQEDDTSRHRVLIKGGDSAWTKAEGGEAQSVSAGGEACVTSCLEEMLRVRSEVQAESTRHMHMPIWLAFSCLVRNAHLADKGA